MLDDPRRDLERVRCPTLLLWGAQDRQTPVSDAFDYARRLRAELRVIPDCGHLLIAERPDACAHALHDVAERVGCRGAGRLPRLVEPLPYGRSGCGAAW